MSRIYPLRRRIPYLGVRFKIQRDKLVKQLVKGRIRIILGFQVKKDKIVSQLFRWLVINNSKTRVSGPNNGFFLSQ